MIFSPLDGKSYDVIVCGAGSAGIAAACAAARAGANTLLLEHYGFGGGILTAAMIHTFDAIKNCADNNQNVVAGIARNLIDEIAALGGSATADNPPEALTIHPEIYKIAVDRLLARSGVAVIYHAHVCGVLKEGRRVTGVEAALRDGRARFRARVVIDGTGDAEVAFHAGVLSDVAPDLQALTYHFRLGGIDPRPTWEEWEEITRRAMQAAHAAGEIKVFGGPWIIRLAEGEISVNSTRVFGNPVDAVQFSAAEQEGRAQMLQIWNIFRQRIPQLARSYLLSGAAQLHVRESRIIRGDYQLTEEDIHRHARFPDSIALGAWPIDIHPNDGYFGVHPHKESPPAPYEIPFRCLLPQGVDGLLVAGKPISTTHRAHGSTRVPGTSLATGQAAGVAAALAARAGILVRAVAPETLRTALLAQGAIVSAAESDRVRSPS
jgi:glycine/D-amino acid oxidase-like deaminating enzyme